MESNKMNYLKNLMYHANELVDEIGYFSKDEKIMKEKSMADLNKLKKLLAKIGNDLEINLEKAID